MDSENESLSEFQEEFYENEIDKFIFNETDYLMDLYYDLKDRIPYFLDKLNFSNFIDFISKIKFNIYQPTYNFKTLHVSETDINWMDLHFSTILEIPIEKITDFNIQKTNIDTNELQSTPDIHFKSMLGKKNIHYFAQEYETEINSSLFIINNYLSKYKHFQINYDTFLLFSYKFTTIM